MQGFLLTLPGFAAGYLLANFRPAMCVRVGRSLMLFMLAIQLLDLLAYTYYRDRLFSPTSAKVLLEQSPSLVQSLNFDVVWDASIQCATAIILCIAAWKISDMVAAQFFRLRYCPSPRQTSAITLCVLAIGTFYPFLNKTETVAWMKRSSDRQPLLSLGLFGETESRPNRPVGREVLTGSLALMALEPILFPLFLMHVACK